MINIERAGIREFEQVICVPQVVFLSYLVFLVSLVSRHIQGKRMRNPA